jgi:hypothetical protein
MSDILAVFGILFLLGTAYPGLLLFCWLLFPTLTERARQRIAAHPQRSFWTGLGLAVVLLIPTLVLLSLPSGMMQGLGWIIILLELAFSGLGAAGLAREIGSRLAAQSSGALTPAGSFLRGAVALELAAIFPLIGWLVVFPAATLASFGAAAYAFATRKRAAAVPAPASDTSLVKIPANEALS